MQLIRIEFDHLPPMLNMNTNHHWGQRASHVKKSQQAVREAVDGLQLPLTPLQRVHLHTHFYLPSMHGKDLEQLRASVKTYVDMLCVPQYWKDGRLRRDGLSIIVDDKMTCVASESQSWELRRGAPGFYIDIQEVL